jgi:hypothetical protein
MMPPAVRSIIETGDAARAAVGRRHSIGMVKALRTSSPQRPSHLDQYKFRTAVEVRFVCDIAQDFVRQRHVDLRSARNICPVISCAGLA